MPSPRTAVSELKSLMAFIHVLLLLSGVIGSRQGKDVMSSRLCDLVPFVLMRNALVFIVLCIKTMKFKEKVPGVRVLCSL